MLYTILDHTASPAIQMFMRRFELRMLITPKAYIATMALKHHVCIGAHFYVILHYGTFKPFNGSIKPHEQRYTDRRREGCYIWYSEKEPGGLRRKEGRKSWSPFITVPNVTALPSTASVPISYYSCGTMIAFARVNYCRNSCNACWTYWPVRTQNQMQEVTTTGCY